MGLGGFIEPAVVITLLFGGTWINRNRRTDEFDRWTEKDFRDRVETSPSRLESTPLTRSGQADDIYAPTSPLQPEHLDSTWRRREINVFGFKRSVRTPNTQPFRNRLLSQLLFRLPFLAEVWYWALIYWVRIWHRTAS